MVSVPSISYSITVRLEVPARGNAVSQLTHAVEQAGGIVTALDVTASGHERLRIDVTCAASDTEHAERLTEALAQVEGVTIGKVSDRTFLMHLGGKIEVQPKVPIRNRDDLSMIYTPGVARVCLALAANPSDARRLTIKRNTVAVVTDGSAVLGLGNLGAIPALPVMEGKAALFKRFAGIDAFPICLDTQDVDEIVRTVELIAPVFAGINLEDISAPRCFEVERRLRASLDIPVFHDDQHGTAIVVLAALINALKVVGKDLADVRIVLSGAGAAGMAILAVLLEAGAQHVVVSDKDGVIHAGREGLAAELVSVAERTNVDGRTRGVARRAARRRRLHRRLGSEHPHRRGHQRRWPTGASSSRWRTRCRRSTRSPRRSTPPWWRAAAATRPTRSTTCSRSPGSSGGCSTRRATRSPSTCCSRRPGRWLTS